MNYGQPMEIEIPSCSLCKDPTNFTYLECCHEICFNCLNKLISKDLYGSECPKCNEKIKADYIKMLMGEEKYLEMDSRSLAAHLKDDQIIICCNEKCKEKIVFEKGNVNFNQKDDKGSQLSVKACNDFANQRCRCPTCKIEFCVECNTSPYHIGKTCEEQKVINNSKKCRYCGEAINKSNRGPSDICCNSFECTERFENSCKKTLNCGHKCYGHKNECSCLPCIDPECKEYFDPYKQKADDYCAICYSESLENAPLVRSDCNHLVHHHCVLNTYKKKWVGPKIEFKFAKCTKCNKWLSFKNNPDLNSISNENKELYDGIEKKMIERMKFEGLDKDKRLSNPEDPFYNNPLEFGWKSIAYYMCSKCKKPYFAGLRDCRQGDNANDREHDPSQLCCGGCGALDGVAGINNCKKHGKEFIEYKCKFCCNVSSWFCWGTTHFCEECHKRQCNHDYVTKIPKDKLPQCSGQSKCNLKINHPPNGEEFALGCSICKNEAANMKNF